MHCVGRIRQQLDTVIVSVSHLAQPLGRLICLKAPFLLKEDKTPIFFLFFSNQLRQKGKGYKISADWPWFCFFSDSGAVD